MSLKYNKLADVRLEKKESISQTSINRILGRLIENDKSLVYSSKMEPGIWEAKWTNDENASGYSQGDAVWYNTEDIGQFILNKADDLYEYVKNDFNFSSWLKPYDPGDPESFKTYYGLITGYVDTARNLKMPPLFDIGTISAKTQIKISLIDDNRFPPSDSRYWKNYFVNLSDVVENIQTALEDDLSAHISGYHFNGEDPDLEPYMLSDFSNVSRIQKLGNHNCEIHRTSREGFDFIKLQAKHEDISKYSVQKLSSQEYISSYTVLSARDPDNIPGTYWLKNRISPADARKILGGVSNYKTVESFMTTVLTGDKWLGNVQFRRIGSTASEFPFSFPYNDEQYAAVSSDLSSYQVQFLIADVSCSELTGGDMDGYYYFIGDYPISATSISQISGFEDKYLQISESVTITEDRSYSIEYPTISAWTRYWNSGYLEQGGTVMIPRVYQNTPFKVKLGTPYEYPATYRSAYGSYSDFGDGVSYDETGNLKGERRYTLSITPVQRSFSRGGRLEIIKIENDGFWIMATDRSPDMFTYRAIGLNSY